MLADLAHFMKSVQIFIQVLKIQPYMTQFSKVLGYNENSKRKVKKIFVKMKNNKDLLLKDERVLHVLQLKYLFHFLQIYHQVLIVFDLSSLVLTGGKNCQENKNRWMNRMSNNYIISYRDKATRMTGGGGKDFK